MPYQGTYWRQPFTLQDKVTKAALNITDWTFRAQFRLNVDDDPAALTIESGAGIEILDAANGRFQFELDEAMTGSLEPGRYFFDLMRTDQAPGPVWLMGGHIDVRKPVTRDE